MLKQSTALFFLMLAACGQGASPEHLQTRIDELQAENETLRAQLSEAEDSLNRIKLKADAEKQAADRARARATSVATDSARSDTEDTSQDVQTANEAADAAAKAAEDVSSNLNH